MEYNDPLEAAHAHIDDDRYDKDVWTSPASLDWTSQFSYELVASLLLICLGSNNDNDQPPPSIFTKTLILHSVGNECFLLTYLSNK